MQDIGIPHLHFANLSDAVAGVPSTLDPKIAIYVKHARRQIRTMFNQLSKIANDVSQRSQAKAA